MVKTFEAVFDGKVFYPDGRINLTLTSTTY